MLEKVPFYAQVLIFAAVAAGIVGMAYFVWPNVAEKQETAQRLEEDSQEKERKILFLQAPKVIRIFGIILINMFGENQVVNQALKEIGRLIQMPQFLKFGKIVLTLKPMQK